MTHEKESPGSTATISFLQAQKEEKGQCDCFLSAGEYLPVHRSIQLGPKYPKYGDLEYFCDSSCCKSG